MRDAPTSSGPALRRRALVGVLLAVIGLSLAPAQPAAAELVGSISGVVTAGGRPIANVWVSATPVTPTGDWAGRGFLASTDAQGRYAFPDVYTPRVKVQARAPATGQWASTYWPRAFTFADAEVLGVAAAGSRADIELAPGGSVRGTVVAGDSGDPLVGSRVSAHIATPGGLEEVGLPGLGVSSGEFIIDALPPVPVLLQATAPLDGNYLGQWYDGAGYAGTATGVDGSDRTTGIRIALRLGAEVSGTVRDDAGAPVAGVGVTLTFCPGLCPLRATTAEDGSYRIGSIPPGPRQMLHAQAPGSGLLEGWHRRPGEDREARLDLRAGDSVVDADITLVRGAFLTVQVVDDGTGDPVPRVSAELVSVSNPILGFLPGSRDRLVVRSGSPMLAQDVSDDPEGLGASGGVGAGDVAPHPQVLTGASPAGSHLAEAPPPGELVIGPVPPGEYRLVLYPGYTNARYLPTTWGEPSGIDRTGGIVLAPEERARALVPLVASAPAGPGPAGAGAQGTVESSCRGDDSAGGSAEPAAAPSGPAIRGGPAWPGLASGVLGDPPAWVRP